MLDSIDLETRLREILDAHRGQEGPLLPILHDVQHAFGYVPEEALPIIAADLQISKAEAHGVMTFYHDFREKPAGRHVLKLCRAEACQTLGAEAVAAHACAKLGLDWHETSKDGSVTLEPIFCLGLCACGPAAMVDGKLVGRVDEAKLDKIIGGLR
ncbi:formate dehydrogenase subunit gamma [Rhodobacter sp.]